MLVAAAELGWSGVPEGIAWGTLVTDTLVYAMYFAAIPVAISVLVRGLERDVLALAPILSAKHDQVSLVREAFSGTPRAVWVGIGVGLLITLVVLQLSLAIDPPRRFGTAFLTLREIVIELQTFAVLGWAVGAALRLSRLTAERALPDLVDPSPFAALARHGTRLASVWLVLQAIAIPYFLVGPEGASKETLQSAAMLVLGLAAFAGILLVLPCRGAHRVLRSAKRKELEAVRSQIGEARRIREDARLPGLLAWEARLEGLSEWPIDAAALGRTGLLVLLPVASWVASAIVARLVDASMG